MSSLSGNEKCVFTFSFNIVTMLNVYLIVLKQRIFGRVLKHALKHEKNIKFVLLCEVKLKDGVLLKLLKLSLKVP